MKNKSIIIFGSSSIWAIEQYYCKYLNSSGFDVTIFDTSKYLNSDSFIFKVKFHLYDLSIYKNINNELLNLCYIKRPDILWVFKGIELYPETLLKLKRLGIFLVNYNPDHPFIRNSPSHGGKNIEICVPLYDLHFSYRKDLVDLYNYKYSIKSEYLPFGFDVPEIHFKEILGVPEINRVSFVGYVDSHRFKILKKLAFNNIGIDVYCNNNSYSKQLIKVKNIRIFNTVYGLDYWKTVRKYRVQLNLLREHNIGSHNQRTFEVPGVGGVLLSQFSQEQSDFFIENKEIFFYENYEDISMKINLIQNKDIEEILEFRKNAFNASISNGYTYRDRACYVANIFKKLH